MGHVGAEADRGSFAQGKIPLFAINSTAPANTAIQKDIIKSQNNVSIPYIKYEDLKELYTIKEACRLFHTEKKVLKEKCIQYDIAPRRNENGDRGFIQYDVRKLRNLIYHEENGQDLVEADDPWV